MLHDRDSSSSSASPSSSPKEKNRLNIIVTHNNDAQAANKIKRDQHSMTFNLKELVGKYPDRFSEFNILFQTQGESEKKFYADGFRSSGESDPKIPLHILLHCIQCALEECEKENIHIREIVLIIDANTGRTGQNVCPIEYFKKMLTEYFPKLQIVKTKAEAAECSDQHIMPVKLSLIGAGTGIENFDLTDQEQVVLQKLKPAAARALYNSEELKDYILTLAALSQPNNQSPHPAANTSPLLSPVLSAGALAKSPSGASTAENPVYPDFPETLLPRPSAPEQDTIDLDAIELSEQEDPLYGRNMAQSPFPQDGHHRFFSQAGADTSTQNPAITTAADKSKLTR